MGDEVKAAVAVVEATVAAEQAAGEAQAATAAAITAEVAAEQAAQQAVTVEAMADRAVENATLDAEQRIAGFKQELDTCRAELGNLSSSMTELRTSNQSLQEMLTPLSWLGEIDPTNLPRKAPVVVLAPSSATDGGTSEEDSGKTKKPAPESGGPEKPAAKDPDGAGREKPASETAKDAIPAPAKPARHRWL